VTAYEIASEISVSPALLASPGAVPIIATFPPITGSHVDSLLTAAAGSVDEHEPALGSPSTIAE
jgi:hypothetical protein